MLNPRDTPEIWGIPKNWGGFFALLSPKNWDFTTPKFWGTPEFWGNPRSLGYPRNLGYPKYPKKLVFEKSKEKRTYNFPDLKVEVERDLVLIGSGTGTSRSLSGA